MRNESTLVVGGLGQDIGGFPAWPLVPRDSNPGRVTASMGGVGHNIAHNLRLLGGEVRLLTALGEDDFARRASEEMERMGISLEGSLTVPDCGSATYLFINDHSGDMSVALSDMEVYTRITPEFLDSRAEIIAGASAIALDTNLPADTIAHLCRMSTAPIFADPVSTAKAHKLRPVLNQIHTIKPNRMEAEILSGVEIRERGDLELAAGCLLDAGLRRVFISLGADGVYCADGREAHLLPCLPARQVSTTGCGDAFVAALLWAHTRGLTLRESGLAGLAAAGMAMESADTINPGVSADEILSRAGMRFS